MAEREVLMTEPSAVTADATRSTILATGIATTVLSRGLAAATPLLVVPIGLGYLGAVGYGAWATALAITGLAVFADLGIGTGVMTKLGQVGASDERTRAIARRYVSTAYLALGAVSGALLLLLWGSAPFVDWPAALGAGPAETGSSVEPIVLATLSAFVVNMVASLVVRVQYGLQQMARSNLWQSAGSLATLAATWTAAQLDPGPGWFVAAAAFSPVLVSVVNSGWFFTTSARGRALAPRLSAFDAEVLREIMGLGSRFLVIAVLMATAIAVDPWIVARTAGLADVPAYSIPLRVFTVIGTIGVMLSMPLWPMHSQAVASGDVAWIRRITTKMTIASPAAVTVAAVLAVLLGPTLMQRWLGDAVDASPVLWVGLALWWIVQSVTGPAFMVQNGAEVLAPQTIGYTLFLVAVPLKWWVSTAFGYEWIPFAGAALYVALIWPACRYGYRRAVIRAHQARQREEVDL